MASCSVIMPVYNAEKSVISALESLRQQTRPPEEIIVINDGSTDRTRELLHQQKDIKLLNHSHRGIVPALNDGLAAAQGDLIARMDADDIAHPKRLERQLDYLEQHPDIGLIGCRVAFGGDRTLQQGYATYVDWINALIDPDEIALNRFIESPFAHPSVMFHRPLFEMYGGYREGPFPEDYELWLRWMDAGVKMGKIDEELLTWNDPPQRLSRTDPRYSSEAFYRMKLDYLAQWLKENNPHYPELLIWGAGRVTRKRASHLQASGIRIIGYIDVKPRKLNCGTPVLLPEELPHPDHCFILSMVGNRGAREQIRTFLLEHRFVEGTHFLFAS